MRIFATGRVILTAILFRSIISNADATTYDVEAENGVVYSEESSSSCVLVYSVLFSFFTSLIGIVIGYFSFMEDNLMRQYIRTGDIVTGEVMTVKFARGGGRVGACSKQRAMTEYIVFVEYCQKLQKEYPVRIRKQMKATDTDFSKRTDTGSPITIKSKEGEEERTNGDDGVQDDAEGCGDAYVDIGPINQTSTLGCPDTIELYVLPEFPTSALPRRQVERSCGIRNRLSTFALIVVDLALAAFCNRFAAEAIVDLTSTSQESIHLYAVFMFVGVIAVQVPIVHLCMRGLFGMFLWKNIL